ncbi:vesicle-associated membrane protein 722 [Vigna radiata var. radiata]|uniref:Vesicle-associated membrane protein 722 n=1 Tax=Vigna radiata var. radiata TaxID=3916 RepID=A0A1S3T749_VIGRR|nr:vesicle-associated membrane protein 722 [Vigna radiata var. radiata]
MTGQQSLIYSFVARGTVILAEHTDFNGNFTEVAFDCLRRLPASNSKFTYNADGHTFNYFNDNGFTYCVVAVESVGRQLAMAFLERIKDDFSKRYGGGKAATATSKSLNKEFGPKLKEHMQYCVEHPEEVSKLAKVKAQVSEVQQAMRANIDQVLDRQVKIDVLVGQTEDLRDQASDFRGVGNQLRRKMWYQNMKIKLIVLAIIIAIILIIVLSVCDGFNCGG